MAKPMSVSEFKTMIVTARSVISHAKSTIRQAEDDISCAQEGIRNLRKKSKE